MSKRKFQTARQLIDEGRYAQARAILETINHPKAAEWIARIDRIVRGQGTQELPVAPEKPRRRTRLQTSTPLHKPPLSKYPVNSEQHTPTAHKRRSQPKIEAKPMPKSRRGLLLIVPLLLLVLVAAWIIAIQQDDELTPAVADNPTAEPTTEATDTAPTPTTVPPTTQTDTPLAPPPTPATIVTLAPGTTINVARAVNESGLVSLVNGLNVQATDGGQIIINASLAVQAANQTTASTLRQIAIEALGISDAETHFTLIGADEAAIAFRWIDGGWQSDIVVTDATLRALYSQFPQVETIETLELILQNFALTGHDYAINAVITVPINTNSRQLAESLLEATLSTLQTQAITLQLNFFTTDGAGSASFTWIHPEGWQANA